MTWASDFFWHGNNKVKKKASPFANHVKAGRNENCATVILFDYEVVKMKDNNNEWSFKVFYRSFIEICIFNSVYAWNLRF